MAQNPIAVQAVVVVFAGSAIDVAVSRTRAVCGAPAERFAYAWICVEPPNLAVANAFGSRTSQPRVSVDAVSR